MTYIRGKRQIIALFYFIEAMWLFVIGRDTRGLDGWDLKYCVYSGKQFMMDKLQYAKRELEIFLGIAQYYSIRTTEKFNDDYRQMFGDQALLDLLIKLEEKNNV